MDTRLAERIRFAPATWPAGQPASQPGDLNLFVPSGLGLAGPAVLMPYDRLEDLFNRPSYYGFTKPSLHPFLNAPVNDDCGGIVYFGGRPDVDSLRAAFGLLGVMLRANQFVAFWSRSENPAKERYIEQFRILAHSAVDGLFHAPLTGAAAELNQQTLTIGEALLAFTENQRELYRDGRDLAGMLGGDGDWAKESLSFGFMVENSYWGVYRIWSRPWLVTK